jgi:hypothetical protein
VRDCIDDLCAVVMSDRETGMVVVIIFHSATSGYGTEDGRGVEKGKL